MKETPKARAIRRMLFQRLITQTFANATIAEEFGYLNIARMLRDLGMERQHQQFIDLGHIRKDRPSPCARTRYIWWA